MVTLYFCLDDNAPAIRVWSVVPRIGDSVSLPEFGGNQSSLKVFDVVYEGYDEPSVSVYLHSARREPNGGDYSAADENQAAAL